MAENDTYQESPRDDEYLKIFKDLLKESKETGVGIYINFATLEISRHPRVSENAA